MTPALEREARRRAGAKLGWLVHAAAYLAVNLLLAGLSLAGGRSWALYPALGWGLGLALHGVVVLVLTSRGGLLERMVERERRQLQLQRDRW